MQTTEHPVDLAAAALDGRSNLARTFRVKVSAVGNWKKRGIPVQYCARIERLIGGRVTRREMRPGDWWEIWPEMPGAEEARNQAVAGEVAL